MCFAGGFENLPMPESAEVGDAASTLKPYEKRRIAPTRRTSSSSITATTTNSLNHIGGFASALSAQGHSCVVAVPSGKDSLSAVPNPGFTAALYNELLERPAFFPDGRTADIIHAWTPREFPSSSSTRGLWKQAHGWSCTLRTTRSTSSPATPSGRSWSLGRWGSASSTQ